MKILLTFSLSLAAFSFSLPALANTIIPPVFSEAIAEQLDGTYTTVFQNSNGRVKRSPVVVAYNQSGDKFLFYIEVFDLSEVRRTDLNQISCKHRLGRTLGSTQTKFQSIVLRNEIPSPWEEFQKIAGAGIVEMIHCP